MKKSQIMKLAILFFAAQFVFSGLLFAQNGVIRELSGTVELKRAGAANFVPARTGDAIAQDTVISTGFKSTALVEIGSSVLTVRPLTRLTLAELRTAEGTENINVNLQTGRVRVDVNPPAGTRTNMEVRGPSATASVRGTSFEFDTRNLAVLHGVVAFRGNRGGTMLVSAGSTSQVTENSKAADPIETNATGLLPPSVIGSSGSVSGVNIPSTVNTPIPSVNIPSANIPSANPNLDFSVNLGWN